MLLSQIEPAITNNNSTTAAVQKHRCSTSYSLGTVYTRSGKCVRRRIHTTRFTHRYPTNSSGVAIVRTHANIAGDTNWLSRPPTFHWIKILITSVPCGWSLLQIDVVQSSIYYLCARYTINRTVMYIAVVLLFYCCTVCCCSCVVVVHDYRYLSTKLFYFACMRAWAHLGRFGRFFPSWIGAIHMQAAVML